jgi:phage terminase Nu1 subunit (DNA packaging protein)
MKEFDSLSQRQVAEAKGCALTTVQNWMRQGCPARKKRGRWVFSLPEIEKWLSERGKKATGSLDAERARLAREQADKLEMENALTRGEMVHIDDSAAVLEAVFVAIRAKILSLKVKIPPNVIGCGRLPEIEAIVDRECNSILHEIAQINPGGNGGVIPGIPAAASTGDATAAPVRKRMGRFS